MVTHDHEEAFAVADRLAVMRAGRVVQAGPIDDVWRAPGRRGDRAVPRLRPGARRCGRRRRLLPRPGCRAGAASPYAARRWSSADDGPLAGDGRVRRGPRRSRCGWW